MMKTHRNILFAAALALGPSACKPTPSPEPIDERGGEVEASAEVILDWSRNTEYALVVDSKNIDPLPATRTITMVHVAMHDAINAARPVYTSYAYRGQDTRADAVAAAAAAAHRVLVRRFPAQAADLDAKLAASLAALPADDARARGVELGELVGDFIVAMREDDGSATAMAYAPGTGPGKYQYVPPFDGFINRPEWRSVEPWVLASPQQLRSAPPPALTSAAYATAYNEVRVSGARASSERTAEETRYARFWYENSDTGWNRVTRAVVESERAGLHEAARAFALVNLAMADGFIAGWDAKFHYDLWRPYTAIRVGETDGNAATPGDAQWEPLLATPPVQDYPSTHSVLGAGAATALAAIFGDDTRFTITSSTAEQPGVETRTFARFSEAAAENGDSRVQAGIHFRFAVDAGLAMGRQIGERAAVEYLRPLAER